MRDLIRPLALLVIAITSSMPTASLATPVLLFQSDGTDASAFNNLSTIGSVFFNTPLAKVFGRDTSLAPLAAAQRFDNDFLGTAADAAFLGATAGAHTASGLLFASGEFANPSSSTQANVFAGLNWQLNVGAGSTNRRIHVQFGQGLLAGGPAAIGGGNPAAKPGRHAAIRVPTNVPGAKVWGQWINNERFRVDLNNPRPGIDKAIERTLREAANRNHVTNLADPRLGLYRGLFDNTQFVDPIESFYIDLENDTGNSFALELEILFTNNLFTSMAQFLNAITVEIGDPGDFPMVYDDIVNNAYLGTTPFRLNLNAPGGGAGGIPFIQINGSDVVFIPEPDSLTLALSALLGLLACNGFWKSRSREQEYQAKA